jgi:hypothetical protein
MRTIKILAKKDIYGGLGLKIYTKDKYYEASYDEQFDAWILDSDIIINERPIYDNKFIKENFLLPEEIRDNNINIILNKSK